MVSGSVVVGIDAGLTRTKAIVLDAEGRSLGMASCPAARHEGRAGEVERDLWQQWDDCCTVVAAALGDAHITGDDVAGVGVTGHGDGLILVDENGSPVRPGILSLDTRAQGLVAELESDARGDAIALESGRPPASGRPVTLLLWVKEHDPASLRAARWILFTKDWLKMRLSGRATTDFTDASGGLLTSRRPVYAEALLHSLGLGEVIPKLPEIVPSMRAAGVVSAGAAEVTGLRRGTPIASGSHDLSASMVGAAATEIGTICAIAGTWSIDATLADVALPGNEATYRGIHGRRFVDGRRALLASSSPAGTALLDRVQWSVRSHELPCGDHLDGILNRELAPYVCEPPVVVPSLRGLGTSHDGDAAVLGLNARHDASTVARAMAEAMAFRHRLGCELLSEHVRITGVRVTGGLARSDLWTQFLTDALGQEVWRPDNPEAGAAGAAAMAGVAAGTWKSIDEAAQAVCGSGATFQPRTGVKEEIDVRYARYLSAIDRLVPSS